MTDIASLRASTTDYKLTNGTADDNIHEHHDHRRSIPNLAATGGGS